MQLMQMARAQVLKSFTLKFQQSNKCLWGNKRGRTKRRTTKELQELDPLGSPHLEEKLIGVNVDMDLLSLFPQEYARFIEGIERGQGFPRSTMKRERHRERENVLQKTLRHLGKKVAFYRSPQKLAVAACSDRRLRCKCTGDSGLGRRFRPGSGLIG